MNVIGDAMETARQRFLQTNGTYYDRLVKRSRRSVQTWLDTHEDSFIDDAVEYASRMNRIDSEEIKNELRFSMRFRALAGIMRQAVEYDPDEPMGGICENLVQNDDGTQYCKVPNNQEQADNYHEMFGCTPACPFCSFSTPPTESREKLTSLTELDDDESLEEAFEKLDIGRIRGI